MTQSILSMIAFNIQIAQLTMIKYVTDYLELKTNSATLRIQKILHTMQQAYKSRM